MDPLGSIVGPEGEKYSFQGTEIYDGVNATAIAFSGPDASGQIIYQIIIQNFKSLSAPVAPVTITGTAPNQDTIDTSSLSLFSNVVVTDLNPLQTETVTVTLSAAENGTLSNLGGGSYNAATGVYTVTGTAAAAVTAALDGLVFTPTANQVAPGQIVTTTFAIADTDTAAATASNSTTTVVAIDVPNVDRYYGGGQTINPCLSG